MCAKILIPQIKNFSEYKLKKITALQRQNLLSSKSIKRLRSAEDEMDFFYLARTASQYELYDKHIGKLMLIMNEFTKGSKTTLALEQYIYKNLKKIEANVNETVVDGR